MCLLWVSSTLESKAIALCQEALQCLTVALVGTDTKAFWELMTAYFGTTSKTSEEDNPWGFLDTAPAIADPLPLTETDDEEEEQQSTKSAPAGPAGTKEVKARPVLPTKKDLLDDLCSLAKAIWVYSLDKDSLNETGVPVEFHVKRESWKTLSGTYIYVCNHPKCQVPPFYAQSAAGIYSHIRRKHLGIALACPYCKDKAFWNSKGWKTHMEWHHADLPAYGHTLTDKAKKAHEMLEQLQESTLAQGSQPARRRRHETSSSSCESTSKPGPKKTKIKQETSSSGQTVSSSIRATATSDSSTDSSTPTSGSSDEEDEPKSEYRPPPLSSLSTAQREAIKEGAYGLCTRPSLEALKKYPHAWKQPRSDVIAVWDLHLHPPAAQTLASSLVSSDLGPSPPEVVDAPPPEFADMPPLEDAPPPQFPSRKPPADPDN